MKNLFTLMIGLVCTLNAVAQGEQRVAQTNDITWLGLDFSKAVVVGETASANEFMERFIPGWNALVFSESKKYDIGKFYKKPNVHYSMDFINGLNAARDPSTIIRYESSSINEDELAKHISNYNLQASGVGLVYVIESFNKLEEKGSMWVVFLDMETNQILLARRMEAKPMGFGVRNYWARTVYDVMQDSGKQLKKWVK